MSPDSRMRGSLMDLRLLLNNDALRLFSLRFKIFTVLPQV